MKYYYKTPDHYQGMVCKLTHVECSEDCTKYVFALVAFAAEMKKKEEGE